MPAIPAWRSLLFVAANNEKLVGKAATSSADAVILDLEDAIAVDAKPAARASVSAAVAALRDAGKGVVVRINAPWRLAIADLDACVRDGIDAIMTPKTEDISRLKTLSAIISEFEADRGLTPGAIGIVALAESTLALSELAQIADFERTIGLALGTEDFSLTLGVAPTPASLDLPCRMVALAASRRARMALAAPISISQFRDIESFTVALRQAAAYGSTGAICIHPAQAQAANSVFQTSEADCARAQAILDAWEAALGVGKSVTSLDGAMIDLPVVELAKRTLARRQI